MSRNERWNALLELLARDGRLRIDAAATEMGVSAATIRRDFKELDEQQMLSRTRGGAIATGVSYDLPLRYKSARRAKEKQRIGRAAAAMVAPGAVVGLNGGTTATEVARALATRPDLNGARGREPALTVVTNALNIANDLAVRPHVKLVVAGGVPRAQSYELVGPFARLVLEQLTLDVAFIGVDAIHAELGALTHNEQEATINQLMAGRARRVVVVADSSKLGAHALARICGIDQVDELITDSGAQDAAIRQFASVDVHVTSV